eukprot:3714532-Lingulodinium_polyedra.AAC.1
MAQRLKHCQHVAAEGEDLRRGDVFGPSPGLVLEGKVAWTQGSAWPGTKWAVRLCELPSENAPGPHQ